MGQGGYFCNKCGHGDGFDFICKVNGWDFAQTAKEVKAVLGETTARPQQNTDLSKTRKKLRRIWDESKPLEKGCIAHRYLLSRGLSGLSFGEVKNLRLHPALDYWHQGENGVEKLGSYPAMVGLVMSCEGWPASLHCTYLTDKGKKADLPTVRKLMTPSRDWKGGAVRLNDCNEGQVLCVAEGIETALSYKLHFPDACVWACISANNLSQFQPPHAGNATIYIVADNDVSYTGQAAAYELARKLTVKKHTAHVVIPDRMGMDYNDVVIESRQAEGKFEMEFVA